MTEKKKEKVFYFLRQDSRGRGLPFLILERELVLRNAKKRSIGKGFRRGARIRRFGEAN